MATALAIPSTPSTPLHTPVQTPIQAGLEGSVCIDENVIAKFPQGTTVVSAERYGTSMWATTVKFCVKYPGGRTEDYFLKSATGDHGRVMMEGEFSAKEIYILAPGE